MSNKYQRKFNYVYLIENNINKKIYIGVHKTDNMEDGYMGSGSALKNAYNKYGKENFTKTILKNFKSYQEALKHEEKLVNAAFVSRPDTYNETKGGNHWEGSLLSLAEKLSKAQKLRFMKPEQRLVLSQKQTKNWQNEEFQKKMKVALNLPKRTKAIGTKVKKWIQEHPEEHQERMTKINKNPEKIRKTAEKHTGMKRTKEGCKNISSAINEALKDPKVRAARSGKGQKYAHNQKTLEVKRFNATDTLPKGWVWGNLKQSNETRAKRSASLVGSYFAYHNDTKEIKRFKKEEVLPDGWIKGRP